jgi:hypothetical protein
MSWNHTTIQGHCDHYLWPGDPIINNGYLLVKNNKYVKYKDFVINSNQNSEQKEF